MASPDFEHLIRNHLKLRHLAVLTAITDHASFQKAAYSLHMTQPAVSRCVKDLETLIGFKLFDRSSKGTTTTNPGEVFIRHARTILAQIRHAGNELNDLANARSGVLAVGCTAEAHMGPFIDTICELTNEHPGIRTSIQEGFYAQLVPMLENGEIDFLISRLDQSVEHSNLDTSVLFHRKWGVFCRSDHSLIKNHRLSLKDVHHDAWIIPLKNTVIHPMISSIFSAQNLTLPSNAIECSSALFAKDILARSNRLMLMPETFSLPTDHSNPIAMLPIETSQSTHPVGITSVRSREFTPAQLLFRDRLSKCALELGLSMK